MKKIFIIFICLVLLCGCGDNKEEKVIANVKKISCSDVNALVDKGAVLIDVRTSDEYKIDHIENSININNDIIRLTIGNYVSDFNTPIIVYCQSGNRSAKSADTLVKLGYTEVYDMGSITSCYGEE